MPNVTGMRLVQTDDGFAIVANPAPDLLVCSPAGERERQLYKRTFNERHSAVYTKTKKVNVYDRIQSFTRQCDIVTLLAKAKTDPSVLMQRQGFYGDFSNADDIRDMHRAYSLLKGDFEALGEEKQNELGGSFENFLHSLAGGAPASTAPTEGVTITQEVSTDEQK